MLVRHVNAFQKCVWGLGPKTANRVCLMALGKIEAFPVDRHIRRGVENYCSSEAKTTDATMVRWAQYHFGSYSSYTGQYLFPDRRQN